jgi:hypothetical protein
VTVTQSARLKEEDLALSWLGLDLKLESMLPLGLRLGLALGLRSEL